MFALHDKDISQPKPQYHIKQYIYALNIKEELACCCVTRFLMLLSQSQTHYLVMKSSIACISFVLALLVSLVSCGRPLAVIPDITYHTGVQQIISTAFSSQAGSDYPFSYTTVMTTSSLNASIGIMSINYNLRDSQMGWTLHIISLTDSAMTLRLAVHNNNNVLYHLTICYLVSHSPVLDINFIEYTFNGSDSIANRTVNYTSECHIDCREYINYQPIPTKTNGRIVATLSGYTVNRFVDNVNDTYTGITLQTWMSTGSSVSNFTINITVYGAAQVDYVAYFYISWENDVVNQIHSRVAATGRNQLGCFYHRHGCGASNSIGNSSFSTNSLTVLTDPVGMFFIGVNRLVADWPGSGTVKAQFQITSLDQASNDARVDVEFAFSGNDNSQFTVAYSYFSMQSLYCSSSQSDKYYRYNSNWCDTHCSNWIGQYANASNFCLQCSDVCYTCTSSADHCLSCFNSQNRILSVANSSCECDTDGGFYDDNVSQVCPNCHYTCLTCSSGGAANCLTCDSTQLRTLLNNSCACQDGYYDNGGATCQTCHYTCLTGTCITSGVSGCLSCNGSLFRTWLTNSTCACAEGYYDNSTSSELCSKCHYSCKTCWTTAVSCSSCDGNYNRSHDSSNNTCPCNGGSYDDGSSLMCQSCHSTCGTCNGPLSINCMSCVVGSTRSLVGTQCTCGTGRWDDSGVCQDCDYSCYTCNYSSPANCTSCNPSMKRTFNTSTGQCLCDSGYVDIGISLCQICSSSCLTCSGNSTQCTSCHPTTARYQAGFSCLCASGYVDILLNGSCTTCHYSCLTCNGATASDCQTCDNNRTLSGSACLCPDGEYDNGSPVCQVCADTCLKCTNGLSSGCTECDSSLLRSLSANPGSCICDTGYYDSGINMCQTCSSYCLTCTTTPTNCSSCDGVNEFRTITSNNTCQCMTGYYSSGAVICSSCSYPCLTCQNLPNFCTSCPADRTLTSNTCVCNPNTFLNSTSQCESCDYTCQTCSSTSTSCQSCYNNSQRTHSGTACPCNFGYYDSGAIICSSCLYSCDGCTGLDSLCDACPASSERTLQADSSCKCNTGFYDDGFSVTCLACHYSCLTCSTYSQCQSCNSTHGRSWNSLTKSCPCDSGSYDSGVAICVSCHYSCDSCTGVNSNQCSSCVAGRNFTSNTCPCAVGYYQTGNFCVPCSLECKDCEVSATNCTACHTGSFLSSNACVCASTYFKNGLVCDSCDSACLQCSTTSTNCTSCNPVHGTILSGNLCICGSQQYQDNSTSVCTSCHSPCFNCTGPSSNQCLSCVSGLFRSYNSTLNSCLCDDSYYDSGADICASCSSQCLTCNGGSALNCTSCASGFTLIGSTCIAVISCSNYQYQGYCVNTCPSVSYASGSICIKCANNCLTCSSSTHCISCVSDFYLYNNTCSASCAVGTYINGDYCSDCPNGCSSCVDRSSQVQCLNCSSGFYLDGVTCSSSCPASALTHVVQEGECVPCYDSCLTCNNLTSSGCLSCKSGYFYHNGMCLTTCPEGYKNGDTNCTSCDSNCVACSSQGCIECSAGYLVSVDNICVQIGAFSSQGQLIDCHVNCLSCTDSSFSSCIACQPSRGDQSNMAISGYCQCWKGSVDLGDGTCDRQSSQDLVKMSQGLVSASSSASLMTAGTGLISMSPAAPVLGTAYIQQYSMFYYLNSTSAGQNDAVLGQYRKASLCVGLFEQQNEEHDHYGRRLSLENSAQSDQSLFLRGSAFQYLIQWALVPTILVSISWFIIFCMAIYRKFFVNHQDSKNCSTDENGIFRIVYDFLFENWLIFLHLLTINDVAFYGFASLKILINSTYSINYFKLILSIVLLLYYLVYLARLVVGCICWQPDSFSYRQLRFMWTGFEAASLKKKSMRVYLPVIMVRMVLISLVIVAASAYPTLQIFISLGIYLLFLIYSLLSCPYPFYMRVFIRIHELVFLLQLVLLAVTVMGSGTSNLDISYVLMVCNYVQLVAFILFGISVLLLKVLGLKCLNKQSNQIQEENKVFPNKAVKFKDNMIEKIEKEEATQSHRSKYSRDVLKSQQLSKKQSILSRQNSYESPRLKTTGRVGTQKQVTLENLVTNQLDDMIIPEQVSPRRHNSLHREDSYGRKSTSSPNKQLDMFESEEDRRKTYTKRYRLKKSNKI